MMNEFEESGYHFKPMAVASDTHASKMKAWLETQPKTKACPKHLNVLRERHDEISIRDSWGKPDMVAKYLPCADCQSDERLGRQGVPPISCGCSFDAFISDNDKEREHLEKCKKWASNPHGLVVLRGDVGTGKTYLAVAILRDFGRGKFVPQRKLLELHEAARLGASRFCGGEEAQADLRKIRDASLLVIDDVGVSSGGNKDTDVLQALITHRYDELKPTVITTNVDAEGLKSLLGDRIEDRLGQAVQLRCVFQGSSKRKRYAYPANL